MTFRPSAVRRPRRRLPLAGTLAAILGGLLNPPAWAGAALDRIRAHDKIVIGAREASVPFSYLDGGTRPIGYSIDLCDRLVDVIRKRLALPALPVQYVLVTSATRVDAVANHDVDLECESATNNAERRKRVAFSFPHFITGARYLVRRDSTVVDLPDFENKRLVSTSGTGPLKAVQDANAQRLLHIKVGEVADHVQGVEMVERGQADGFAMDEVLLNGLVAARKDPEKLKIVGKFITIDALGIMMPADDPEMKALVDTEMKRLVRSGEAREIYNRWFLKPIPPRGITLDLPMNYLMKEFWEFPSDWLPN